MPIQSLKIQRMLWLSLFFVFALNRSAAASLAPKADLSRTSTKRFVRRAVRFLTQLYDPRMRLLPEYRGSSVFWLFHDNLLAEKVLARYRPALAHKIKSAIHQYHPPCQGAIMVLLGHNQHVPPFHQTQLMTVAEVDGKVIKNEVDTANTIRNWRDYADLLLLAAISNADRNRAFAKRCYRQAMAMWDGQGFWDNPAQQLGRYSAFKLALAIIASRRLGESKSMRALFTRKLIAQQDRSGGVVTDYNGAGKRVGLPNVETTCLAILALQRNR